MKYLKILIVATTAIFIAYHTQIFISKIEPNFVLSWVASFLVEGMIITLAISRKTILSSLLLTLLFIISVLTASASFVVQNEDILNRFITQKRQIEMLQKDILDADRDIRLGQRYVTKSLQRQRQLKDELHSILSRRTGDVTIAQSAVFFLFVLILQATSVYIASSLKQSGETQNLETGVSSETSETLLKQNSETVKQISETVKRNSDTLRQRKSETVKQRKNETMRQGNGKIETLKQLRDEGHSYREIANRTGLSVSKVVRVLRSR